MWHKHVLSPNPLPVVVIIPRLEGLNSKNVGGTSVERKVLIHNWPELLKWKRKPLKGTEHPKA